jgi:hypothetical protein
MSETTPPAIEVHLPEPPLTKFERERRAFYRLLPELLNTHRGQYVAIHEEQVVDSGPERLPVAMRVLERIGPADIYVGLVSVEPRQVYRSGVRRDLGRRQVGP